MSKMKRPLIKWEKIFKNYIFKKWLISKIYKELIQHNIKKKNLDLKMGRRLSWAFFQRRHRDDQQIHEKMFNINNHQGNANQTHNEISSHTCKKVCMCDQLCPTFYDPMDCSSPGSSVHGIFQARKLEWVAISSSRGSSWPRDRTCVFCLERQILYQWAMWEVPCQNSCYQKTISTGRDVEKRNVFSQYNSTTMYCRWDYKLVSRYGKR